MSSYLSLNAEIRRAKGGIAFPGALLSWPGICVARGMKNLNEVVRMGLGSIGVTSLPSRLGRIWRNSTCSRATKKQERRNLYSLRAACC